MLGMNHILLVGETGTVGDRLIVCSGMTITLETEFDAKLDDSGARIRSKGPTKVTRVDDYAGGRIQFGRANVADWIAFACVIQCIEKIRAKFQRLSFAQTKALHHRKVEIGLGRAAQNISSYVSVVRSEIARNCHGVMGTWDWLARHDDCLGERQGIEVVVRWNLIHQRRTVRASRPVRTRPVNLAVKRATCGIVNVNGQARHGSDKSGELPARE